jgi:hypothetical protein
MNIFGTVLKSSSEQAGYSWQFQLQKMPNTRFEADALLFRYAPGQGAAQVERYL